ncbi:MAG TPA: RNA polymerase sigma factor [Blastocatellia bacterium]|nr:RNA polymerase sigma factor [Blastocatellia bacterium]
MTELPRLDENAVEARALARIVERAKEGDSDAFEHILTCHQHKVVAIAWRILGNREDARDAAQEVFLRVYRHLKKFRAGEDFAGWLYRITINVCRDVHRRRGPSHRFESFDSNRNSRIAEIQDSSDVEAATIVLQEQAIVARALATLSPKEREAIVLRDLEGLPTEEVARILGSSATTVRSQISSARTKIKLYRQRVLSRRRSQP